MRIAGLVVLIGVSVFTAACGGGPEECDDVQRYQESREGQRLVVPEGLDDLESGKEMVIPDPSPQAPANTRAGCLDRPPGSYATDKKETDVETPEEDQT